MASRHARALSSAGAWRCAAPAELMRTSIVPSVRQTSSAAASAASDWRRSAATGWTRCPAAFSCRRAASRFSGLRDTMATWAPSRANAAAQASPMPLLPPVTSTTLPSSSRFILCLLKHEGGIVLRDRAWHGEKCTELVHSLSDEMHYLMQNFIHAGEETGSAWAKNRYDRAYSITIK